MTREPKSLAAAERVIYGMPPDFGGRAAASTVEAVKYELQTYGIEQLKKMNTQRRIAGLSPQQLREVVESLERQEPRRADLIEALKELAKWQGTQK